MNKFVLLILISTFIAGCTSFTHPTNNKEFKNIKTFKELEGVYTNRAEPHHRFSHLSNIIWRRKAIKFNGVTIPSEKIKYIKVTANKKNLVVSAIKNNCIIYNEKYIYGKDIEITDGKIVLNNIGYGGIIVGPGHEKRVIGLDTNGDGKYKFSYYGAGLVFFLIPVASAETHEIRYKKLKKNLEYPPCENR